MIVVASANANYATKHVTLSIAMIVASTIIMSGSSHCNDIGHDHGYAYVVVIAVASTNANYATKHVTLSIAMIMASTIIMFGSSHCNDIGHDHGYAYVDVFVFVAVIVKHWMMNLGSL